MTALGTVALVYIGVFVAIQIIVRFFLRHEPTDHGQIVGRQMGCIVGLLWPVALPYLLIVGTGYLAVKVWRKIRKGEA